MWVRGLLMGGLLGMAGCGCEATGCAALLRLELASEAWPGGAWRVELTGEGLDFGCDLEVTDGSRPGDLQIRCDGLTNRSSYLPDTGQFFGDGQIELEARVPGAGATTPSTVRVTVAIDGMPVLDETRAPAWREVPSSGATCFTDCRFGTVAVAVP